MIATDRIVSTHTMNKLKQLVAHHITYRKITWLILISIFILTYVHRHRITYFSNHNKSNINNNPYGNRGEQHLPDVIIPGVMKSGTGATLNFLENHPDIKIARKEQKFFNNDQLYNAKNGMDIYRSHMPWINTSAIPRQITIEKSPDYFEHLQTPERIHAMNSSIKIVVVLREPIKRAMSDYARTIRMLDTSWGLNVSFISFEALATPWFLGRRIWESFPPIQRSVYIRDLQRWYDHFPARNIHIVDGERLVIDPYVEMRQIETFLGIRHFYEPKHFRMTKEKMGFYCHHDNNGKDKCMSEGKGHVYKPLEDKVGKLLKEYFEPYNQELYALVGRDFGWRDMDVGKNE